MIDDGIQDNRYHCRSCGSKQNGKKKLSLESDPQVLVISLKRFFFEPSPINPRGTRKNLSSHSNTIHVGSQSSPNI